MTDMLVRDGRRHSLFRAYVRPYMTEPNLTVLTGTMVRRVLFEGKRAIGVEIAHAGRVMNIKARYETVLSMGAMHTPKVLMHSGIGDQAELARFNIPLVSHLPGVGRNLQDHVAFSRMNCFIASRPSGPGMASPLTSGPKAFALPSSRQISTQAIAASISAGSDIMFASIVSPEAGSEPWRRRRPRLSGRARPANMVHPCSGAPRAAVRSLGTGNSTWQNNRSGLSNSERVFQYSVASLPVFRGPMGSRYSQIEQSAVTYWHQSCTAKMGRDELSVVDSALKVYGVEGLRVADASIMPRVATGNTQAPCAVIGERAARMIRRSHNI